MVVLVVVWLVHEIWPNLKIVEFEGTHQWPLKYNPLEYCRNVWSYWKKLPPSNFQFSKIITESFSSTFLSNNEVWVWEMIDLDLNGTGIKTDTDSEIWLRSSRNSKRGVEIGSKMGSKSKNWCSHTFSSNEVWSKRLVIPFQGVLVQDSMLTLE